MEILRSLKIKNYKSILDEKIELSNMIAFIGANESGKSNILKAINHLSKEKQNLSFKLEELNLSVTHLQNHLIELEYEIILYEHLIPKISSYIPTLIKKHVFLKKSGFPNKDPKWSIKMDNLPATGNLVIIEGNKNIFKKTLLGHSFKKGKIDKWIEDKYFISTTETNLSRNPFYSLKRDGIIKVLDNDEKIREIKRIILEEVLKNINVYFWKYRESNFLEENIPVEEFCNSPKANASIYGVFKIAKDEGAFAFNLDSRNLTEQLINSNPTIRNNLLKGISKSFNKIFKKAWSTYFGTSKIELIIGYEGDNLSFRFDDGRECPPEYRSDGLKWFLTFLINFQSKQKDLSNYILIMDEPGGLLHPKGQKDALYFILKLAENNQILYSTHQTFLIDKNNPQNVRILDRKEKVRKLDFWPTKVYSIKNTHKHILKDSLLREALGFTLSDISPINENNILVEGTFDRNVILFCNEHFKVIDMNNCSIISSGKASSIKYQAQHYISNGLKVVCVYDNDNSGKHAFDNNVYVKSPNKIFISNKQGETIEDILPEEIFINAFKKLCKKNEFKNHFKNQEIVFKKPYIANTFNKQIKGSINQETRQEIKHTLEDLMLELIQKSFDKSKYQNIESILKTIRDGFEI